MKSIFQTIAKTGRQPDASVGTDNMSQALVVGTFNEHPKYFNNRVSILYVEDNVINQMIGLKVFKNLGCICEIANSGQAALDFLSSRKYDLIFMDINMPILDGLQTTRYIREKLHLELPVIAITTNTMESDVANCFEAGMNDHVGKPYSQHQLSNIIFKWCTYAGVKY